MKKLSRKIVSEQVKISWNEVLNYWDPCSMLLNQLNKLKNNVKEAAGDNPKTDFTITLIVETEIADD